MEEEQPTHRMFEMLASGGIAHHLDEWGGPAGSHDWRCRNHQMWEYVRAHFSGRVAL